MVPIKRIRKIIVLTSFKDAQNVVNGNSDNLSDEQAEINGDYYHVEKITDDKPYVNQNVDNVSIANANSDNEC